MSCSSFMICLIDVLCLCAFSRSSLNSRMGPLHKSNGNPGISIEVAILWKFLRFDWLVLIVLFSTCVHMYFIFNSISILFSSPDRYRDKTYDYH